MEGEAEEVDERVRGGTQERRLAVHFGGPEVRCRRALRGANSSPTATAVGQEPVFVAVVATGAAAGAVGGGDGHRGYWWDLQVEV